MKKLFLLILSLLTISSFAQTPEEVKVAFIKLKIMFDGVVEENQNLIKQLNKSDSINSVNSRIIDKQFTQIALLDKSNILLTDEIKILTKKKTFTFNGVHAGLITTYDFSSPDPVLNSLSYALTTYTSFDIIEKINGRVSLNIPLFNNTGFNASNSVKLNATLGYLLFK